MKMRRFPNSINCVGTINDLTMLNIFGRAHKVGVMMYIALESN